MPPPQPLLSNLVNNNSVATNKTSDNDGIIHQLPLLAPLHTELPRAALHHPHSHYHYSHNNGLSDSSGRRGTVGSAIFRALNQTHRFLTGGSLTGSKLALNEDIFAIFDPGEVEMGGESCGEENGRRPLTKRVLMTKIREKKAVINKLRCQSWDMRRKRRILRYAQNFLEQNESRVSRTQLFREDMAKRWRLFVRWAGNVSTYFIPWESRIRLIESQFGSVVSSYFTFLRWIIFVNLLLTAIILALVVAPEVFADATADATRRNLTASRKQIAKEEASHADEIAVVWHFDGYLRYSPLFYGFYGYSNLEFFNDRVRYPLPLAYFFGCLLVFGFSFFAILRKMAINTRRSKLAGTKADQYVFSWYIFTGWDYSIGNSETASNAAMSATIKLREAINECHQILNSRRISFGRILVRLLTNAVILGMIALSIFCIHSAVQQSEAVTTVAEKSSLAGGVGAGGGSMFTKNQVPLLMGTITHVFPMIFDLIGRAEKHHPRMQLRLQLIRVLALYVINYATLIFSLFEKLDNIRDITTKEAFVVAADESPQSANTSVTTVRQQHPFLSRNFAGAEQFLASVGRAAAASPLSPFRAFNIKSGSDSDEQNRRKLRRQLLARGRDDVVLAELTKRGEKVTVDGRAVTVHAQFGPVGVTNPNILLRNATPAFVSALQTTRTPYETRRIGPTPLPVFHPPPLPPTPQLPTYRKQNYGPHWGARTGKLDSPEESADDVDDKTDFPFRPTTIPYVVRMDLTPASVTPLTRPSSPPKATTKLKTTTSSPKPKKTSSETRTLASTSTPSIPPDQISVDEEGNKYNDQICWETMIGQEIVKLVTMDLYITVVYILLIDFMRGWWIRCCNSFWCWNIEETFPEYGEFKVAENVLHIINNQGMVWLGLFFAPLLPAINNIKLIAIMYIKGWAVITCNVPAREIFRASRSSNFFLMILLLWLLLCTLPVGYVITSKRPSTLCGPFAGKNQFYEVVTNLIEASLPRKVLRWLRYVASPGVIIPIILLLVLIIFFLVSLVRGLREANTDLQKQLIHERTEEKKKIFELAGGGSKRRRRFTGLFLRARGKKPAGPCLTDIEKKRREPWRNFCQQKPATDGVSSLCPSDVIPSPSESEHSRILAPIAPSILPRNGSIPAAERRAPDMTAGGWPSIKVPLRPYTGDATFTTETTTLPASENNTMRRQSTVADQCGSASFAPPPPAPPPPPAVHPSNRIPKYETPEDLRQLLSTYDTTIAANVSVNKALKKHSISITFEEDEENVDKKKQQRNSSAKSVPPPTNPPHTSSSASTATVEAIYAKILPRKFPTPIPFAQTSASSYGAEKGPSPSLPRQKSSDADEDESIYEEIKSPTRDASSSTPTSTLLQSQQPQQQQAAGTVLQPLQLHNCTRRLVSDAQTPPPNTQAPPMQIQRPALLHLTTTSAASCSSFTPATLPAINNSRMYPVSTSADGNKTLQFAALPPYAMTRSFPSATSSADAPHRISIYQKEPRRFGQQPTASSAAARNINNKNTDESEPKTRRRHERTSQLAGPPKKLSPSRYPPKSPPKKQSPTRTGRKFEVPQAASEFVPWPTIEEVKAQRAELFRDRSRASRSPPKMIRTVNATSSAAPSDYWNQRFRISVSPTRRKERDSSIGPTRRYVVKQSAVVGSVTTMGEGSSTASSAHHLDRHRKAPRVEFGDDDSPHVEYPPSPTRRFRQQ